MKMTKQSELYRKEIGRKLLQELKVSLNVNKAVRLSSIRGNI